MPHCCKVAASGRQCPCMEKLPGTFTPGPLDVICARGKAAKSHPGNQRYQKTIESYMNRYVGAKSKLQKMAIISEIVTKVRFASPNGGFVKLKEGNWYEVGDHFAREKVSQSMRDSLHAMYRSSCRSKTIRRALKRKEEELARSEDSSQNSKESDAQTSQNTTPSLTPSAQIQALSNASLAASLSVPMTTQQQVVRSEVSEDLEKMVAHILVAQARQCVDVAQVHRSVGTSVGPARSG